jgi:hypothetical protein
MFGEIDAEIAFCDVHLSVTVSPSPGNVCGVAVNAPIIDTPLSLTATFCVAAPPPEFVILPV